MNIVFDHQIFYGQRFGGISRYFYELASGLNRRDDFSISIVAPFHVNEYLRNGDRSFVKGSYFNQQFCGAGRIRHWGRKLLLPLQYSLNRDTDLVHETYFSMDPFGRARFRVVTVHDMIHEMFAGDFKNDIVTSKAKIAAVQRADHVICVSESTRRDLIRLMDVNPNKTSVIYHGFSLVNDKTLQPQKAQLVGKPYLLYVGHRGGYKNFITFCRAVASSHALKKEFDIIAFGGGIFRDDEKVILNEIALSDQVRHVDGDDSLLEVYYQNAALFVYPSLYEGFGIPPLEAMNFNCPVVCSNTSSMPEVVGNAGIYFDPYSIDSMCDAMERAVGSASLRAELVSKGKERLKKFSWEKCVSETAKIYKAVASGLL